MSFQWPQPNNAAKPSFGAFGSTPATSTAAPGTNIFGAQNQSQPQPTQNAFGSFGQNAAQTNTATQPAGVGMFGQNLAPKPTGFSFGATPTAPAASTNIFGASLAPAAAAGGNMTNAFGNFGAPNTATMNTAQPNLFGAPQQNSQFGQPAPQQQSFFDNSLAPPTVNTAPTSSFAPTMASAAPNIFGISNNQSQVQRQASTSTIRPPTAAATPPASTAQKIQALAEAWDPRSPNHPMQYYFYNVVDPQQVHLYGRPQNAVNDALWNKAVRENPNPSCLVPVLAVGMDDLRRRADASKAQAYTHIAKLQELSKKNSELLTSHTTRTAPQLTQVMHTHIHLVHRITMLTRHLHLFIPSIRSSTMRGAEEKLRATLEAMEGELRRPGGLGRVDGRVGELWGIVNRAKVGHSNSRKGGDDAWAVGDEDGLKELAKLLEEQQRGLEHVTKVLQKALKDLSVLSGGSSQSAHTTSASASSGGYGNAR